jgi:hypothetical protein
MYDKIDIWKMVKEAEEVWCVDTAGQKWLWSTSLQRYYQPNKTGSLSTDNRNLYYARTPDKKVWKASYLSGFYEYSHTEGEEMKETITLSDLELSKADFWAIDKDGRKWIWKTFAYYLENETSEGTSYTKLDSDNTSYYATTKDGRVWKSRNSQSGIYDLVDWGQVKTEPIPIVIIDPNNPLQIFRYGKELKVREFNLEFDEALENVLDGNFRCHSLPKKEEPLPQILTGSQLKEKKATFWAIDEKGEKWIIPGDKWVSYIRVRDHYACIPEGMDWGKTRFFARTQDDKVWIWDVTQSVYRLEEKKEEPPQEALVGGYSDERLEEKRKEVREALTEITEAEEVKPSKPSLFYRILDFILP